MGVDSSVPRDYRSSRHVTFALYFIFHGAAREASEQRLSEAE